jgi:hypothetical protein
MTHAHAHCLLPRAHGMFTRLYAPAVDLTTIVLIFTHMPCACVWRQQPLPSHVDCSQPSLPPLPPLPSPYSASSAYPYSYAYTNTPPSSQCDCPHLGIPKRDSRPALGGRWTAGTTCESPPLLITARVNRSAYGHITFMSHPRHHFPVSSSCSVTLRGRLPQSGP